MISIFLLDDDPNVTDILKRIIGQQELGRVCGVSQDPEEALEDLRYAQPDLVIVDLLMPGMDGVTFVKRARQTLPAASYIMLSQVSSKDMIASAYDAGVEFFIQKPINGIEVVNVIRNVAQKQSLQRTMDQMTKLISATGGGERKAAQEDKSPELEKLRRILSRIGILGVTGAEDIVTVCADFLRRDEEPGSATLKDICTRFSDAPKSMEQRIRRAAAAGMTNLAHMGLDDYYNEDFSEYAGMLYSFEQIRREMDYIQGKTRERGNVKIKQFLTALLHASRE